MVSFSYEHLKTHLALRHQRSRVVDKNTKLQLSKPIWKVRCTHLNSGLKTGLIAKSNGQPTTALRADIDALHQENTDSDYQSQTPGHACLWPWFPSSQPIRPVPERYGSRLMKRPTFFSRLEEIFWRGIWASRGCTGLSWDFTTCRHCLWVAGLASRLWWQEVGCSRWLSLRAVMRLNDLGHFSRLYWVWPSSCKRPWSPTVSAIETAVPPISAGST